MPGCAGAESPGRTMNRPLVAVSVQGRQTRTCWGVNPQPGEGEMGEERMLSTGLWEDNQGWWWGRSCRGVGPG